MDKQLRTVVEQRAKGDCEYCKVPTRLDRLPAQVDHIIAEKHGGLTNEANLAWSCFDCNIYKGPNIAGIDPKSGEVAALFHPRNHAWVEHFRWMGGNLQGLTAQGRATIAVLRINLAWRVAFREELQAEGTMTITND